MGQYTDDEIRAMPKITIQVAAKYLGISSTMLTLGMRNNVLPIGFAVKNEDRYRESWSYSIIPERLIAYNHGKINEVQVQNIEKNLNTGDHRAQEENRGMEEIETAAGARTMGRALQSQPRGGSCVYRRCIRGTASSRISYYRCACKGNGTTWL